MDIFFSVFQAVAMMFGIGIIGFLIIYKRMLDASLFSLMTPLVVDIALPSLVITNIVSKFSAEKLSELWIFPLAWIIETIYFFVLTILLKNIARKDIRNEFAISLFYQNGIFLPIIIISQVYGQNSDYLVKLFLFTFIYPAFFFNTYHLFFDKKNHKKFNFKNILNFVLLATIFSILIKILKLDDFIPQFIFKIFYQLGSMTIPLLMIIIGGNIYLDFQNKAKFEILENFKFVLAKNFIFPAVTIFLLYVFKINKEIGLILFLESVVPPITAIPIFVSRAEGNTTIVNQFLISSFLVSLISIPIFFSIYNLL